MKSGKCLKSSFRPKQEGETRPAYQIRKKLYKALLGLTTKSDRWFLNRLKSVTTRLPKCYKNSLA